MSCTRYNKFVIDQVCSSQDIWILASIFFLYFLFMFFSFLGMYVDGAGLSTFYNHAKKTPRMREVSMRGSTASLD